MRGEWNWKAMPFQMPDVFVYMRRCEGVGYQVSLGLEVLCGSFVNRLGLYCQGGKDSAQSW